MKSFLSSSYREFFLFILGPFLLWVFCLWNYFSFNVTFIKDAVSYFEHISFFTDNLRSGVFPLWHPDWAEGAVAYNFFLRRIGDVNPIFWVVILLKAVGLKSVFAYLSFLALYFFLGVLAFWQIAKIIFRDKFMAYAAYWLLLFSWGGQLFFTYIVILLTPILWFFYFMLAFGKERKRHQFLGACFCLGILLTTYIPFFFLTIVGVLGLIGVFFFGKKVVSFLRHIGEFAALNPKCFVLGVLFVIIASIPAINFYQESKQGEFVLPGRHADAVGASVLTVGRQLSMEGDLITQGYFENIFENHSSIRIESFFISYFFLMVIVLSVINPLTRRGVFFFTTAIVLTVISVTESTPVYRFIHDHVFFFKFMRNIYYLFWLAILPLSILFGIEQLKQFIKCQEGKKHKGVIVFVVVAHSLMALWLLRQEGILWSAWVALMASLLFFLTAIQAGAYRRWALFLLMTALLLQPAHILHTMAINGTASSGMIFNDAKQANPLKTFSFIRNSSYRDDDTLERETYLREIQKGVYYANRWYADVFTYVPENERVDFMKYRLYFADNTTIYEDNSPQFFRKLGSLWAAKKNVVFLAPDKVAVGDVRYRDDALSDIEPLTSKSPAMKVIYADANTLKVQTRLARSRFLVWTDSYSCGWHVYINGKEGKVLRAFHAFKGVWIPEGENTVLFRYASPWRYLASFLLMGVFILMLGSIFYLSRKEGFCVRDNGNDQLA